MTRNLRRSSVARRCAYIPRKSIAKQKRKRLNEVETFEWPHRMWHQATILISKITFIQVIIYGVVAYGGLSQVDGLRAVDIVYLMTATITTVGLGDISPQAQLSRITAIFLLPYGLVVVSLVISLFTAHYNSMFVDTETTVMYQRHAMLNHQHSSMASQMSYRLYKAPYEILKKSSEFGSSIMKKIESMKDRSIKACIFISFLEYLFVLFVGSSFFLLSYGDRMFEHTELGEKLTVIDSLYFTSVVSTTVGYGANIYAESDSAKWFMSFFFIFSTFVVAHIIADLSGLYLDHQENNILMKVMGSVADVYKCDLDRNNEVDESDFVLFKLLQLQKVDTETLEKLIIKFESLDVERKGFLHIGVDIPHAIQSADLTRRAREEDTTEAIVWDEHKEMFGDVFKSQHPERFEQIRSLNGYMSAKCNRCDRFQFSRQEWSKAQYNLTFLAFVVLCIYVVLGTYGLVYLEGLDALKGAYFLSASITTVGFGDIAPTKQSSRAFAIFILPFGLILIGMGLSIFAAHTLAVSPVVPKLRTNPNLFMRYTKFPRLLLEMYLIVTPCAVFMHYCPGEQKLGWVDSFYFATVTATTIGYGDIAPTSDAARLFLLFYMPGATLALGNVIRKLSQVFLVVVEERINDLIIHSPTSLYRADLLDSGFLNEPDYILYKLQQMQKLDKDVLDRMIDLFEELDVSQAGFLRVGVDIPSRLQQEEIEKTCSGGVMTSEFNEKWEAKKLEIAQQAPLGRSLDVGIGLDGGLDRRKKLERTIMKMSIREPQLEAEEAEVVVIERKLSGSEEMAIALEKKKSQFEKKKTVFPSEKESPSYQSRVKQPVKQVDEFDQVSGIQLKEQDTPSVLIEKHVSIETKSVDLDESEDVFDVESQWRSPVRKLSKSAASAKNAMSHEESKQHFSMMSFQWK